jgi:hypothetical protein
MGTCAECGADTQFEWVRPDAEKQKIEQIGPKDLICLRCYMRLHWSQGRNTSTVSKRDVYR